ncbi:hypothetical protein [Roseibium algae]|uniref:Uncharacterized protein n=1 Tax=Roseibium algae TaxID=3123038 RepID=A0ABU8TQI9_9HYPH
MSEALEQLQSAQDRNELATVYRVVAALSKTQPPEFSAEWNRAFKRRAAELGLEFKK